MSGRVLLIEDNANITEALCFILLRDGWDVEAHSDGTTAIEKLREFRPDVLVLDVMLPGRSGYEILQELRADADFCALPVLMLTARGQERERLTAEVGGADLFMTKPFSNAEILANLRQLVGG
ncbi:MAG: response regulator [Albidovulum sp.]|jgi:DNA-binding response OmpR family regulator